MKTRFYINFVSCILVMTAFSIIGCSEGEEDEEEIGFNIADVVGNYRANTFVFFNIDGDGGPSIDLVNNLGGTVFLDIEGNGDFTISTTLPNMPTAQTTGRFSVMGDEVFLEFDGGTLGPQVFFVLFDSGVLRFRGPVALDLDDDDIIETATLNALFIRL